MPLRLYKLKKSRDDVDFLLGYHRRLVYKVLTDMNLLGNQDAESDAWQGLWDAIETFDVFATNAFSSYAYVVISNEIKNGLRKSNAVNTIQTIATEYSEHCAQHASAPCSDESEIYRIYNIFDTYVATKTGVNKNVLLAWYGTGFEGTTVSIAEICGCSASYVSRVQTSFRAYVSSKLMGD